VKRDWRFVAIAGLAAGLALAPAAGADPRLEALGALPLAIVALAALRPGGGDATSLTWQVLVAMVAALAGLLVGEARLAAIDAGALRARPGGEAAVRGVVAAVPRRDDGEVSVRLDTPAGRLLAIAPEPVAELEVGSAIGAEGVFEPPEPWRQSELRRHGIAMILRARRLQPLEGGRGGLAGWIDALRGRAERSLSRGMPEREAALARGFVLGEDDRIDPRVRDDFKRSGLAHLLAVSGQNVLLLCLLAWPLLALCGLTLRARLVALLVLIAVYVPVTGAGPSIQRAGVMGAAGLVAALAERPRSRAYAVLLAAAVTLTLNPRTSGDVGWQLSFAAVIGIMLWSGRLTRALTGTAPRGSPRRALAEGVAVTAAATVATAPLMAHHFESFSLASLPANLLALPAVAPAMWLGMLAGMAGQLPAIPVEPVNWVGSLCLAYIAQVANWLADPSWSLIELPLRTPIAVASAYLGLIGAVELLFRGAQRRSGMVLRRARGESPSERGSLRSPKHFRDRSSGDLRYPAMAVVGLALLVAGLVLFHANQQPEGREPDNLMVRVLDVGQGDSILIDPPAADPVLIDAGPAEAEVVERLRELGVESLAAAVISHDQSDHAGGLGELLASLRVGRVVYGQADPRLRRLALAAGSQPLRLAEGGELDSGSLRLTALWPPPELARDPSGDRNALGLALLAEWENFSMLLSGDAEAEAAPLDPGPIDVLKVAHHGSEDAGLAGLLEHAVPKLAVISVGEDNPYGHPAPKTVAVLNRYGVHSLRTDQAGEVAIEASASGWTVTPEEGG
jgi:competence protein ComEC